MYKINHNIFFLVLDSLFPRRPIFCFIAVSPIFLTTIRADVYSSISIPFPCLVVASIEIVSSFWRYVNRYDYRSPSPDED